MGGHYWKMSVFLIFKEALFSLEFIDFSSKFFLFLIELFFPHVQFLFSGIEFLQVFLNFLFLGRALAFPLIKVGGFSSEPVFEFFKFFVLEGKFVFDGQEGVFPELKLSESFGEDLLKVFGVLLLLMQGGFGGLIGAFLVSDEVFVVLALFGEVFDLLAEGVDSLKEKLVVVGGLFCCIFGADLFSEL